MSILDSIKDVLDGDGDQSVLKVAQDLLGGGLDDVKSKFESIGLGEKLESWIGKGDNQPATAEDMKKAFGEDKLKELADREGTDPDTLVEKLAGLLPKLIDKATPEGDASKLVDDVKGLLGKIPGL